MSADRSRSGARANSPASDYSTAIPDGYITTSTSGDNSDNAEERLTDRIRRLRMVIDARQVKLNRLQYQLANLLHRRAAMRRATRRLRSDVSMGSGARASGDAGGSAEAWLSGSAAPAAAAAATSHTPPTHSLS